MNIEKYTQNTQRVILDAQNIAIAEGQQMVETEHVHLALMKQKDGLIPKLLNNMNIDAAAVEAAVQQEIDRLPKFSGGSDGLYASRNFNKLFMDAEKYAEQNGVDDAIVLIHDGVRPLITEETITDNIVTAREKGNCITCVPATETFVVRQDDGSLEIPDRNNSLIARAPQTFRLRDILDVDRKAMAQGQQNFIDSCTMMSHYGYRMNTIIGPMENIKITTPTDFFIFRAMIQVHENQQIFGF